MLHQLDLSEEKAVISTPVIDDPKLSGHTLSTHSQKIEQGSMKKTTASMVVVICAIALAAGVGTGWGSFKLFAGGSSSSGLTTAPVQQVATGTVKAGDVFGSKETAAFKDNAKGYLEKGGVDGEGSHKLLRIGGISQTVYLTSSVTDLDKFVGMEVEVWGETFAAQKAGWLMDVGRVQVVKVQGENPSVEE